MSYSDQVNRDIGTGLGGMFTGYVAGQEEAKKAAIQKAIDLATADDFAGAMEWAKKAMSADSTPKFKGTKIPGMAPAPQAIGSAPSPTALTQQVGQSMQNTADQAPMRWTTRPVGLDPNGAMMGSLPESLSQPWADPKMGATPTRRTFENPIAHKAAGLPEQLVGGQELIADGTMTESAEPEWQKGDANGNKKRFAAWLGAKAPETKYEKVDGYGLVKIQGPSAYGQGGVTQALPERLGLKEQADIKLRQGALDINKSELKQRGYLAGLEMDLKERLQGRDEKLRLDLAGREDRLRRDLAALDSKDRRYVADAAHPDTGEGGLSGKGKYGTVLGAFEIAEKAANEAAKAAASDLSTPDELDAIRKRELVRNLHVLSKFVGQDLVKLYDDGGGQAPADPGAGAGDPTYPGSPAPSARPSPAAGGGWTPSGAGLTGGVARPSARPGAPSGVGPSPVPFPSASPAGTTSVSLEGLDPGMSAFAQALQGKYGGHITAGKAATGHAPNGYHPHGKALDFVPNDPSEWASAVRDGIADGKTVRYEPTNARTGKKAHLHFEPGHGNPQFLVEKAPGQYVPAALPEAGSRPPSAGAAKAPARPKARPTPNGTSASVDAALEAAAKRRGKGKP